MERENAKSSSGYGHVVARGGPRGRSSGYGVGTGFLGTDMVLRF